MKDELTIGDKIIGGFIAIVLVAIIALGLNVIPWLIWNNVVSPMFGWRTLTFWQVFFISWLISIIGSFFRRK